MLLTVDIGNTHIVLACVESGKTVFQARLASDRLKTEFEYAVSIKEFFQMGGINACDVEGACISSVNPELTKLISDAVKLLTGEEPLVVGAGVKTGLNIRIDNPSECGADLVTAAVGAMRRYKLPMIIIDLGTATTFSAIDRSGAFLGGAIAPGLMTSLEALSAKTALLPSIALERPSSAIGKNTADCMRSGAVLGTAGMIDGIIDRMSAELGDTPAVIATGGLAETVVPYCTHKIEIAGDLILEGLAAIYEKNKKK